MEAHHSVILSHLVAGVALPSSSLLETSLHVELALMKTITEQTVKFMLFELGY